MDNLFNEFNNIISNKLGFTLRKYQEHVANEIIRSIEEGHRFIIVSMPTGSGKTLIEIFTAFYGLRRGFSRILTLEPTRFLCDQMYSGGDKRSKRGLWSKVLGELVGKEYEGYCSSFLEPNRRVIISTPQTALKCTHMLKKEFRMIIIDEVHHAFGGKYYTELLTELKPDIIIGFTALLPSYKKYRLDPEIMNTIGEPYLLTYDFKKLEKIDPDFKPPRAIADIFDAELNSHENKVYDILFRAVIQGDSRTIKFLEITLARHGKEAFCESYRRALEKNKIIPNNDLEKLCTSNHLSHKARTLVDVLTVYDIVENSELKPVLAFTSRKATANEFKRAIVHYIGLPEEKVAVLTSDMNREERLKLIKKAKNGEIDVIVSTLVGEEGVDIPEAGLLIMTDVPKSPLRFYQRLGRLIRMSSPRRMKYLVVALTPKTIEYEDLEDALWNLYMEDVDVSYIIVNINIKSPSTRVLDIVNRFARIYNDTPIPYTLLAFGQELSNPLNYIFNVIKNRKDLVAIIQETMKSWGFHIRSEEDLNTAIFYILTFHMLRWGDAKKIFKPIDTAVNRSRFSKEFNRAVRERKIFYIYDVATLSEIITYKLQRLYHKCMVSGERTCYDEFFRIDRKSILRLFTKVFPYNNMNYVIDKLKIRLEKHKEYLNRAKKNNLLQDYTLEVLLGDYNKQAKTLPFKVIIYLNLDNTRIGLDAQINYYDINEEIYEDKKTIELIKLNLRTIGYEASKKFLDQLYEYSE